jgi:CO/xanthine dehydrogenase Mo-binding subunit
MRGFGAVQACFGIESTLDLLAERLGMDPVELRRRNVLRPGDRFPTSGQSVGDAVPLLELIDQCVALPLPPPPDGAFDLPGGTGGTTRGEGVRRGVGFALGVKNHLYAQGVPDHAGVVLVADAEGVEIRSAATEVGQGIGSALLQIATDALGGLPVRLGQVTSDLPPTGSSSASRQTWISGGAVLLAAEELARRLRDRAGVVDGPLPPLADLLGDETIEVVAEHRAPATSAGDPWGQGDVHVSWMFVAHRAVVDVDVDLGIVRLAQVATAQDVGRAINPREVHGQITGGIAQGVGLALYEHLDATGGIVTNASLADYLIPTAADVAPVEAVLVEVPDPVGPLGLKGVGEPPTLSSGPAVAAAVRAATGRPAPRLPIRPEDLVG